MVFQASCAALTFLRADSSVNGGNGGLASCSDIVVGFRRPIQRTHSVYFGPLYQTAVFAHVPESCTKGKYWQRPVKWSAITNLIRPKDLELRRVANEAKVLPGQSHKHVNARCTVSSEVPWHRPDASCPGRQASDLITVMIIKHGRSRGRRTLYYSDSGGRQIEASDGGGGNRPGARMGSAPNKTTFYGAPAQLTVLIASGRGFFVSIPGKGVGYQRSFCILQPVLSRPWILL